MQETSYRTQASPEVVSHGTLFTCFPPSRNAGLHQFPTSNKARRKPCCPWLVHWDFESALRYSWSRKRKRDLCLLKSHHCQVPGEAPLPMIPFKLYKRLKSRVKVVVDCACPASIPQPSGSGTSVFFSRHPPPPTLFLITVLWKQDHIRHN